MTKLEAWKAWCETAGTQSLANEFTLEKSSHGKAFSFAWDAAHEECAKVCEEQAGSPRAGTAGKVPRQLHCRRHPRKGEHMKRIDYFWPRAAVQVTGIIHLVQLLTEDVGNRKPGFEWVTPASGALFAMAVAWTLYAVVVNAIRARGETK